MLPRFWFHLPINIESFNLEVELHVVSNIFELGLCELLLVPEFCLFQHFALCHMSRSSRPSLLMVLPVLSGSSLGVGWYASLYSAENLHVLALTYHIIYRGRRELKDSEGLKEFSAAVATVQIPY